MPSLLARSHRALAAALATTGLAVVLVAPTPTVAAAEPGNNCGQVRVKATGYADGPSQPHQRNVVVLLQNTGDQVCVLRHVKVTLTRDGMGVGSAEFGRPKRIRPDGQYVLAGITWSSWCGSRGRGAFTASMSFTGETARGRLHVRKPPRCRSSAEPSVRIVSLNRSTVGRRMPTERDLLALGGSR